MTCSKKYLEANIEHVNFHSQRLSFSRNLAGYLIEGWLALRFKLNGQIFKNFRFCTPAASIFQFFRPAKNPAAGVLLLSAAF